MPNRNAECFICKTSKKYLFDIKNRRCIDTGIYRTISSLIEAKSHVLATDFKKKCTLRICRCCMLLAEKVKSFQSRIVSSFGDVNKDHRTSETLLGDDYGKVEENGDCPEMVAGISAEIRVTQERESLISFEGTGRAASLPNCAVQVDEVPMFLSCKDYGKVVENGDCPEMVAGISAEIRVNQERESLISFEDSRKSIIDQTADEQMDVSPQEHTYSKQRFPKTNLKEFQSLAGDDHQSSVDSTNTVEYIHQMKIHRSILSRLKQECQKLASKKTPSVLRTLSNLDSLTKTPNFIEQIFEEIQERSPFLLAILATVTGCSLEKNIPANKIAAITSAYSILMKARNLHLTAWHKMVGCILARGHLEDQSLILMNNLGVSQSPSTKLRMMKSAVQQSTRNIISGLKENPLVKITGDNLDVFIKSASQQNKDLHLFASNIIWSTTSINISREPPVVSQTLAAADILPDQACIAKLEHAYAVLVGRIIKNIPSLSWMEVPEHIHHPKAQASAQKTKVLQLPIMFRNEAKYEDCIKILENYETELTDLFSEAHGDCSALHELNVVIGGDQLTRIRLEKAKQLRHLAPNAENRFEDLGPFVIEWWHNKQDFLEKAYKALFSQKSLRQPGTLYHYKAKFNLVSVNGNVKGNFQVHHDLLIAVANSMISEQAKEYFGLNDSQKAMSNMPDGYMKLSKAEKIDVTLKVITAFIRSYGYLDLCFKDTKSKVFQVISQNDNVQVLEVQTEPDEIYNYCSQLCSWALHLMELDDTAKEGDHERLICNSQLNIPFYHSHSSLSKYLIENVDFVTKVKFLLSPLMREVVLDTAFVNTKGGRANCVEADLVQEHSVRNQKALIKQLGANKNDHAIKVATGAADAICEIVDNVRISLGVKKQSTRHTKKVSNEQISAIITSLSNLRPFRKVSGRKCIGYSEIVQSPFLKVTKSSLTYRLNRLLKRIVGGRPIGDDGGDLDDLSLL